MELSFDRQSRQETAQGKPVSGPASLSARACFYLYKSSYYLGHGCQTHASFDSFATMTHKTQKILYLCSVPRKPPPPPQKIATIPKPPTPETPADVTASLLRS